MSTKYDAVLHIGAGKTGSSAIQTFLRENQEALKDYGFVVPSTDFAIGARASGHHVFALQKFFEAEGVGLFHQLNHMMKSRDGRTVILSAENISNNRNFQYFRKFCQEFSTKVIFYVRRQDDFLASAWQQWHSKVRGDIGPWLDEIMKGNVARWDFTIENWEQLAGGQNVTPRIFERQLFPEKNVVKDFVDTLGLDVSSAPFSYVGNDVNTSYSYVLTSIVAGRRDVFDGAHDEKFYRYVAKVTNNRYNSTGNLSLISRSDRERIIEHYKGGNETIRARYFSNRPTLFSPLDHSKYRYADEIDLASEQIKVLTDIALSAFKAQRPEG